MKKIISSHIFAFFIATAIVVGLTQFEDVKTSFAAVPVVSNDTVIRINADGVNSNYLYQGGVGKPGVPVEGWQSDYTFVDNYNYVHDDGAAFVMNADYSWVLNNGFTLADIAPSEVYQVFRFKDTHGGNMGTHGCEFSYTIDSLTQLYTIRLHFFINNRTGAYRGQFDVYINGNKVDLVNYANYASDSIVIIDYPDIEPQNGTITVAFDSGPYSARALVNGIELIPSEVDAASKIIINQVYGGAADGAISHGFVELYNPSDTTADLDGYSVQVRDFGGNWTVLSLDEQTIAAHHSFLIRTTGTVSPSSRYVIDNSDLDWNISMDSDAFSVALVSDQNALSNVITPQEQKYVKDLVGVSSDNYLGAPVEGVSAQKAARRIYFFNTGNNNDDFEILDYRNSGIDNEKLEEVRPRFGGDGEWSIYSSALTSQGGIIINQVYGGTDGAVSHGFIELYNTADETAYLNGYSVQVCNSGGSWNVLNLNGNSIAAHHSFLIRATGVVSPAPRYIINNSDSDWNISINNRAFSVALVANQNILSNSITPQEKEYIIDLVGAVNDPAVGDSVINYFGAPAEGISKQKTARRVLFLNTRNNYTDFEILDYRSSGIDNQKLDEVKPRYSGDGAWGENIHTPDFVPEDKQLIFSKKSGLYVSPFNLALATGYKNGIIKYTVDGSDPTAKSSTYTSTLAITDKTHLPNKLTSYVNIYPGWWWNSQPVPNKGNIIKARVYSANGTPLTEIYTTSYFINPNNFGLPIFSIVTEEASFFDDYTGIYVNGNWDNSGADWERPVYLEMFEPNGEMVISRELGVRLHGAWSRRFPQKTLRFYARSEQQGGGSYVDYDFFQGSAKAMDGSTINSFKRFLLRNQGTDSGSDCSGGASLIRDGLGSALATGLNVPTQAYRPSIAYLNGEFWGLYDIRERIDEYFISSKYSLGNSNNIMIFTNPDSNNIPEDYDPSIMETDYILYSEMMTWFDNNADLSLPGKYEKAQTFIDIDNWIDAYAVNSFSFNWDWPGNNLELWRYQTDAYPTENSFSSATDGRWRIILKDLDAIFNSRNTDWTDPRYMPTMGADYYKFLNREYLFENMEVFNAPHATLVIRRLFTSPEFVEKFVNRACDILNTNFKLEVINAEIDRMVGAIENVVPLHQFRWNWLATGQWQDELNRIHKFVNTRHSIFLSQTKSWFSLPGSVVTLTLTANTAKGHNQINGIDISAETPGVTNSGNWNGTYFEGFIQTVNAVPEPGYQFDKFIVNGVPNTQNPLTITLSGATSIEALFKESSMTLPDIIINQIHGTTNGSISHSFVELYNSTDSAVSLNNYSVQTANGEGSKAWNVIPLTGKTIQPHHSFLIRFNESVVSADRRYNIPNADMDRLDIAISNKAFSVALVANQAQLSNVITSNEMVYIIDLVGAVNTPPGDAVDNYLGNFITDISKQKTARRINFADTQNNRDDFEILDYRRTGIGDVRLEDVRPRYSGDGAWPVEVEPEQTAIVINQIYSGTSDGDGSISHGFIELYNTADEDIALDGFTVQVSTGTERGVATSGEWKVLSLAGEEIKAKHSFLIRMTAAGIPANKRYAVENSDIDWNIIISNRAYSVALVDSLNQLSPIITEPEFTHVKDLVGATNTSTGNNADFTFNYLGAPIDGISKQKAIRRLNFVDTRHNYNDFETLDYRTTGISETKLEKVKPRWSGDGAWPVGDSNPQSEKTIRINTGIASGSALVDGWVSEDDPCIVSIHNIGGTRYSGALSNGFNFVSSTEPYLAPQTIYDSAHTTIGPDIKYTIAVQPGQYEIRLHYFWNNSYFGNQLPGAVISQIDGGVMSELTTITAPYMGISEATVARTTTPVTITGNQIVIDVTSSKSYLLINGIEIIDMNPSGVTVSGKVKSYNPNNVTKISLLQGDVEKYSATINEFSGNGQTSRNFVITNVMPGNYMLTVQKDGHLSYIKSTLTIGEMNEVLSIITLIAGDINNDSLINSGDLSVLLDNYGKFGTNISNKLSDINGDEQVDSEDLSLLLDGYGKSVDL